MAEKTLTDAQIRARAEFVAVLKDFSDEELRWDLSATTRARSSPTRDILLAEAERRSHFSFAGLAICRGYPQHRKVIGEP